MSVHETELWDYLTGIMRSIVLQKGRERSLLRRHPWIFSGAVQGVDAGCTAGETVDVVSSTGEWLARGSFSPASKLRCRIWTFNKDEVINQAFFVNRLQAAARLREKLGVSAQSNSYRLIHGEADGIPGCVIDIYGEYGVCQFLCAGSEAHRADIVSALKETVSLRGVYERSDTDARARDGLEPRCGRLDGEEPPELFELRENNVRYLVDIRNGHKTGFYLDQRENRRLLDGCSEGAEVLNCFCYTGGFGIRAGISGAAHVTQVDLSQPALDLAERNAALNGIAPEKMSFVKADVFAQLRKYRDMGRQFDTVILDPPKFADTPQQLEKASRGYKDINLLGAKLTRLGGTLFAFSCSGAMTPELFAKIVGDALRDAGREGIVNQVLCQADDHPVSLDFPEGRYLTGLKLTVR